MCRNIKTLFNFDPSATDTEIRAASVQFVRKISGSPKPSQINEAAFEQAVDKISITVTELLNSLITTSKPKNRYDAAAKAKARFAKRFNKK